MLYNARYVTHVYFLACSMIKNNYKLFTVIFILYTRQNDHTIAIKLEHLFLLNELRRVIPNNLNIKLFFIYHAFDSLIITLHISKKKMIGQC